MQDVRYAKASSVDEAIDLLNKGGVTARVLAGGPEIESVVSRARADAPAKFSLDKMVNRYEALFAELLAQQS